MALPEVGLTVGGAIMSASPPAAHIVIAISSLGGGGAERVVVDLCDYLITQGRKVTLITLSGEDTDAFALPTGVDRMRLEIRRDAQSIVQTTVNTCRQLRSIRAAVVSLRPDVVVSFVDQTNVRVVTSLLLSGIAVVVSERTTPSEHGLGRAWSAARKLVYRRAAAVVVQTRNTAAWMVANVATRRVVIIPNALRLRPHTVSTGVQHSHPFALAAGRLTREKGMDLLIAAFAGSNLVEMGWRLVILGDGPEKNRLQEQARQLGIAEKVSFPGFQRNATGWIQAADIVALPSRYEGFPNVLVEGMQLGRPCIAFNCPSGPSDIIQNEQNGLLVPPGDVARLSEGLARLASDPDLRTRLGKAALRVNETLAPAKIYSQWLALLDDVAGGRRRLRHDS